MEIQINKDIVVQKELTKTVGSLKVVELKDNYVSVTAILDIPEFGTIALVLWEGQDYINIGQWTDQDVNNRIIELF